MRTQGYAALAVLLVMVLAFGCAVVVMAGDRHCVTYRAATGLHPAVCRAR